MCFLRTLKFNILWNPIMEETSINIVALWLLSMQLHIMLVSNSTFFYKLASKKLDFTVKHLKIILHREKACRLMSSNLMHDETHIIILTPVNPIGNNIEATN